MHTLLLLTALFAVSPAMAGEGPEPPSAPTPGEARSAESSGPVAVKPGGAGAGQANPDSKPATADAASSVEAVRKAQQNGGYRLKDGDMYEPPASRPVPQWNEGYGRT